MLVKNSLYGHSLSIGTGLYGCNRFSLFEGKTSFDIFMKWQPYKVPPLSLMPVKNGLYGHPLSVETGLYGCNQFILFEGKTSFHFFMKWHTYIKFPTIINASKE